MGPVDAGPARSPDPPGVEPLRPFNDEAPRRAPRRTFRPPPPKTTWRGVYGPGPTSSDGVVRVSDHAFDQADRKCPKTAMPRDELDDLVEMFGEDGLVGVIALGGGQINYEDVETGEVRSVILLGDPGQARQLAVFARRLKPPRP